MPDPCLVITTGEPAGIGPDIVVGLDSAAFDARLVIVGNRALLEERAAALGVDLRLVEYGALRTEGAMELIDVPLAAASQPGQLDAANASYVLELLERACRGCLDGEFDAMVTAPVSKEIINSAGIGFSGHTEYLAELCASGRPVMLLIAGNLRVALVTTHMPLRAVADAISGELIEQIATLLHAGLQSHFGLPNPRIKVCGLNPHAGENGYLGHEENEIIIPALQRLRDQGIDVPGPYPADTLFTQAQLADADAILAMYHDQGLPVLKHYGFHAAVNTTLGLPIVRTSVDHGTALDLAGTGEARPDSLVAAIESALYQVRCRQPQV
ncbi:MAG: 4-hydroxythreonine-4-phosphate dehydrogenase PdxA [Gammaproteobacteria bacterium]|nr:4-hydroxythreonine-4-phosphate dehydrogenase PdxA [Gammaproteobacteria bacterium]